MSKFNQKRGLDSLFSNRTNNTPFRSSFQPELFIKSPSFFISSGFRNDLLGTNNMRSQIRTRLSFEQTQNQEEVYHEAKNEDGKNQKAEVQSAMGIIMDGLRELKNEIRKKQTSQPVPHQLEMGVQFGKTLAKQSAKNKNSFKVFDLRDKVEQVPCLEFGSSQEYEQTQYEQIAKNLTNILNSVNDYFGIATINQVFSFVGQFFIQNQQNPNQQNRQEIKQFDEPKVATQTKLYRCRYCPAKFGKPCSLGGHISRVHRQRKIQTKSVAKNSLNKIRVKAISKKICKYYNKE